MDIVDDGVPRPELAASEAACPCLVMWGHGFK